MSSLLKIPEVFLKKVKSKFQDSEMSAAELQYVPHRSVPKYHFQFGGESIIIQGVWIVFTPIDTIFIIQQQLLSSIPFVLLQCGSSFDDGFSHIQGCSFVMLSIFGFRGRIYWKNILYMDYLVLLSCCCGNLHKLLVAHTDNSLNFSSVQLLSSNNAIMQNKVY